MHSQAKAFQDKEQTFASQLNSASAGLARNIGGHETANGSQMSCKHPKWRKLVMDSWESSQYQLVVD
jgi:hypothetical protein